MIESDVVGVHVADAALAKLPPELFSLVVTHPLGRLHQRAPAILELRTAWLRGEWPETELGWPNAAVLRSLRTWVERSDLLPLCRDSVALTDELLTDVLRSLEKFNTDVTDVGTQLLQAAMQTVGNSEPDSEVGTEPWQMVPVEAVMVWLLEHGTELVPAELLGEMDLTLAEIESLRQTLAKAWAQCMEQVAVRSAQRCVARVESKWSQRLKLWRQLQDVFGPLAGRLGIGWDLSAGVFQSGDWRDLKKYRDLIDRIPEIRQLIEELGRLQTSEEIDDDPKYAHLFRSLKRTQEEQREIEHPLARHQAQGVERSDDFMRMIPSEAMLRRRSALKRLWHAKLAERGLLTYRVRGTYVDRVSSEVEEQQPQSRRRIRGPIIVCIDTSGSMSGTPEAVAKALVLEACRTAHAEDRRCLLFSFSGPNQCAEHELSLTPDGLQSLLEFLTMNFDGGTDISTPFKQALSRLRTAEWERADILLVSDGVFSSTQVDAIKSNVDDARSRLKLRVAGLLVGCSRTSPMSNLCDPLILVRDWK